MTAPFQTRPQKSGTYSRPFFDDLLLRIQCYDEMDYGNLFRKIKSIPIFLLAIIEHWFLLLGGVVFAVVSNFVPWLNNHFWIFPILGLIIAIFLAWYSEYEKANDLKIENSQLKERESKSGQLKNPEQLKILIDELQSLWDELNILAKEGEQKTERRNKAAIFYNGWNRKRPDAATENRNLTWIFDFEKWLIRLESYFSIWPDGIEIFKQLFVAKYFGFWRGGDSRKGMAFYSFGMNADWFLGDDLYRLKELIKNM